MTKAENAKNTPLIGAHPSARQERQRNEKCVGVFHRVTPAPYQRNLPARLEARTNQPHGCCFSAYSVPYDYRIPRSFMAQPQCGRLARRSPAGPQCPT